MKTPEANRIPGRRRPIEKKGGCLLPMASVFAAAAAVALVTYRGEKHAPLDVIMALAYGQTPTPATAPLLPKPTQTPNLTAPQTQKPEELFPENRSQGTVWQLPTQTPEPETTKEPPKNSSLPSANPVYTETENNSLIEEVKSNWHQEGGPISPFEDSNLLDLESIVEAPICGLSIRSPVENANISQYFGVDCNYQDSGYHTGVDYCDQMNTPEYCVAQRAVVEYIGPMFYDVPGKGRGPHAVVLKWFLEDGTPIRAIYSHNSAAVKEDGAPLRVGDIVEQGDQVALMGNTGYCIKGAVHLHFEIYVGGELVVWDNLRHPLAGGRFVDPLDYIDRERSLSAQPESKISIQSHLESGLSQSEAERLIVGMPIIKQEVKNYLSADGKKFKKGVDKLIGAIWGAESNYGFRNPDNGDGPFQIRGGGYPAGYLNKPEDFRKIVQIAIKSINQHAQRAGVDLFCKTGAEECQSLTLEEIIYTAAYYNGTTEPVYYQDESGNLIRVYGNPKTGEKIPDQNPYAIGNYNANMARKVLGWPEIDYIDTENLMVRTTYPYSITIKEDGAAYAAAKDQFRPMGKGVLTRYAELLLTDVTEFSKQHNLEQSSVVFSEN